MDEFSITPWEHRGSGALAVPHARAQREIGGRERRFQLKMHEGTIYFREPKRAPVWAITRDFGRELRGEELVEAWQMEMARDNYGRYLVYAPHLAPEQMAYNSSAQTALSLVHRADYSGSIREWFDATALPVPAHRDGKALDMWGNNFQAASRRAFNRARATLLDRALPAAMRQNIEARWVVGDEAELQSVFELGLRLFVRAPSDQSGRTRTWPFAAANPVSPGGWEWAGGPSYHSNLQTSPVWFALLKLMERHFVRAGLKWRAAEISKPNPLYVAQQLERWGDDWRGLWQIETPALTLEAMPRAHLSAHDKLEATLQLRDWLDGKVSPRQRANWLSKAL